VGYIRDGGNRKIGAVLICFNKQSKQHQSRAVGEITPPSYFSAGIEDLFHVSVLTNGKGTLIG
jgi:hypothetical protein